MADPKFPTEVVSLPSKGYFYPEDNPLSSGEIEIKYMTAREEDILTSTSLIQKGIVLDKLLESLVVTKVDLDTLLVGDKNAILIASRVLAYGKEYKFEVVNPESGNTQVEIVDLTTLKSKEIDTSKFEKGKNEFEFELPSSKRKVLFKLPTQSDEKAIDSELLAYKKISKGSGISPEVTTRLKRLVIAVDGNRDRSVINKFVDNEFLTRDSFALRAYLVDISPDVDMTYTITGDTSGKEIDATVPMTVEFFWPTSGI